jgi:DNA invertase Pin-like site-specific DNA recombinase
MSATEFAALYRRVSTDHQDNSLEVQESLNTEYCKRMGIPVLAQAYEDPDVSGSIPFIERTGGKALLARLLAGDVKHLVTAKQDRLGRDTLDTIATIRTIWDLGITPHFPAEGGAFPRTAQNELLFEIKASVAQYERNLIRDRTRAVMNHKFNRGELTGNVPFGFDCLYTYSDGSTDLSPRALPATNLRGKVVSKILLDNPAEQATIRAMAHRRAANWTLEQIADDLNVTGVRTKLGCQWQAGNVASVLQSRHTEKILGNPK